MGRVTLNPIAHIDPIGTVLLPLILVLIGAPAFGWAKPVPVNPYNLRNPRRDNLWISAAGPAANMPPPPPPWSRSSSSNCRAPV